MNRFKEVFLHSFREKFPLGAAEMISACLPRAGAQEKEKYFRSAKKSAIYAAQHSRLPCRRFLKSNIGGALRKLRDGCVDMNN